MTQKELSKKLGGFKGVENFYNKNQFLLRYQHGEIFQSYNTIIGIKIKEQIYLTPSHTYSMTTSKHTTLWCGFDKKERLKQIENGKIILIDNII